MFSSLRVLAWRVVEQGRSAVVHHGTGGGALFQSTAGRQNAGLFRYLQHQQALNKSISIGARPRGRGGGPPGSIINSGLASQQTANGPLMGLLGRLGPFVTGAVRRLSKRNTHRRSLYRDTAPLFALVGVTLLGFEEDEDNPNRRLQGFVTRQEELEAICGNIRETICYSGWLQNNHGNSTNITSDVDVTNNVANNSNAGTNSSVASTWPKDHVFSLQDLELSGVIDKGCNAVVYAAKWKNADNDNIASASEKTEQETPSNRQQSSATIDINNSSSNNTTTNAHQDSIPTNASSKVASHSDLIERVFNTSSTSLLCQSYSDENLNTTDALANMNLGGSRYLSSLSGSSLSDLRALPPLSFHGSTVSLQPQTSKGCSRRSSSRPPAVGGGDLFDTVLDDSSESDSEASQMSADCMSRSTLNNSVFSSAAGLQRSHQYSSLSQDVSKMMSNGRFGHKTAKTVRFAPETAALASQPLTEDTQGAASCSSSSAPISRPPPRSQFPLAVKLVFNYEAASNAPSVLTSLYRELVPARSLQLDQMYKSWRDNFFGGGDDGVFLPCHPNVVDMPCAFVDRVPLLPGGMQLYPTALPPRLNPSGAGRNMSLFCVMHRYDVSLETYLTRHPHPTTRTSLLMLTQLLEALQHLHRHHVSHRDIKQDNILLSLQDDDWSSPWLVLTDFGCCLAASANSGLSVPFVSREGDPRQGNLALMAPEVKGARPGLLTTINFSSCDLWAAGTLAYQLYGLPNPFLGGDTGPSLDSLSYREGQLPGLHKTSAPAPICRLVADMLKRRQRSRPSPTVAATICQLALWAPSGWLNKRSLTRPSHKQVLEWLVCLTTKVLYEKRGNAAATDTEYRLVSTLLARVRYADVLDAIAWNKAF